MKEPVIVINAGGVLENRLMQFNMEHREWEGKCRNLRNSYKQKTSRMEKNGNVYEYTKWYKIIDYGASLECVGDKEPDWKKLMPPEPKLEQLPATEHKGHLVMEKKDYEANIKLFKECLAFRLEDCQNRIHPLYKNLDKALKGVSVRKDRMSSGGSRSPGRTEKKGGSCWNDGDCDNCEHNDECPVAGLED